MRRLITRLAGASALPPAALGLVSAIAAVDRAFRGRSSSFAYRALEDEPCHLATAIIGLGAVTRWRGRPPAPAAGLSLLAASVLIDIDHLPLQFGSEYWTRGTPRPYSHALWPIAALTAGAAIADARHRATGQPAMAMAAQVAGGAACGVALHLLRDVGTGPVALWWPLADSTVNVAYSRYLMTLLAMALVPGPAGRATCAPGSR